MDSSSLDELAVFRRTSALAQEACDLIKRKMRDDPAFLCQVEHVSPESVVRQVWAQCYRRAIEEALAAEDHDGATRH
jgi:hypothetical protein